MGAARARQSRNVRLLTEHPYCIYCGGTGRAEQVDHAPPIAVFTLRRRPEGLEFPACVACHEGTRKLDAVAAFYSRLYPDPKGEDEEREVQKLYRGMVNAVPVIGLENGVNRNRTADYAHAAFATEQLGPGTPLRVFGPWVRFYLDAFFARMALALHYQVTGTALAETGTVYVRSLTNTALLRGDVPPEIIASFGQFQALMQKGLTAERDFSFGTMRFLTDDQTAAFVNLRISVGAVALCVSKPREGISDWWTVFSPGFLKKPLVR